MKLIYFDPACGVSGDMFAGALLDLGLDFAGLQAAIASLGLDVTLKLADVSRYGMRARKFDVLDTATGRPSDEAEHVHRHLADITELIERGKLSDSVKADAIAIFELIAEVEAKAHGISKAEVHFHEVGAVDAIVDIVSGAWLFNELGASKAVCGAINVGSGTVRCRHGELAVPAPAVAELLKGMIAYSDGIKMELATPTGVALLKHFSDSYGPLPAMTMGACGYGAGTKELERPNVFRIMVGN
ncbi:MAG: LarC family nickel insertion protein [Deferribacteraceae bacterium]|jgi:uncharacterized protein (TIGR00299 family) protein|nr:LarC family nickel insertion protein [Deferribacteraceae bacterium]